MNIEIRKGVVSEKDDIFQVYQDAIEHMNGQGIYQWNEYYPNMEILLIDLNDEELYILTDGDEILGSVVLNEYQEDAWQNVNWGYPAERALVIHRLAVHPKAQGRGLAKQLLLFTEEFARVHGYGHIRLDTYAGNPKAVQLYESFGYQKRGEVDFDKQLPFFCMDKKVPTSTPVGYLSQR